MNKELKSQRLGEIIQESRKKLGKRQEDIAALLGVSRPTFIAIEKGERALKPSELAILQTELNFDLGNALRDKPYVEPFQIRFRAMLAKSQIKKGSESDIVAIEQAIEEFNQLVTDYIELEYILQTPLTKNYPEPYAIKHLPIDIAAEQVANRERSRLDLGIAPITDMRSLLEDSIGIRVFFIDMPSEYSGMFHYSEVIGGCIAINRKHPYERQQFSLAHEYAHMIAHRNDEQISVSVTANSNYNEERFANSFAEFFLMPRDGVLHRFNDIWLERQNGKILLTDIVGLAHYFSVSVLAMVLRLEDLGALNQGTMDRIKSTKIKIREVQHELGLESKRVMSDLPLRFKLLAYQAYSDELISQTLLAKFLRLSIVQTREFIQEMEEEIGEPDIFDFAVK